MTVRETPVGFKYINELMMSGQYIFGAEESGGIALSGNTPDKDGILACMLVLEMIAMSGKNLKQIFKDFSSGIGGNVITFIMEYEKVDYLDAIKIIADEQRLDVSEFFDNSEKSKEYADDREKIKRIHKLTQNFFIDNLQKSQEAIEYLHKKRKLTDNIIKQF